MTRRTGLLLALLALGFLAIPATEEAQETGGNPHGPLRVGCEHCHSPQGWTPLRKPLPFDHGKETGFPLVKSHKGVSCVGCHRDLRFAHVATACADCHENVHQGTLGFNCEQCHTPQGWRDRQRIFEIHAASLLPLTGAHATLDCEACHRQPPPFEHAATPVNCVDCHLQDYLRARPDHQRLGFPQTCDQCHDTSDFANATFRDHDRLFPIFSGTHQGVWDTCTDCHTGGNFQSFSCLNCHEHRRSEMDDEHDDVRGYRYESRACLSCHPTGRE